MKNIIVTGLRILGEKIEIKDRGEGSIIIVLLGEEI